MERVILCKSYAINLIVGQLKLLRANVCGLKGDLKWVKRRLEIIWSFGVGLRTTTYDASIRHNYCSDTRQT